MSVLGVAGEGVWMWLDRVCGCGLRGEHVVFPWYLLMGTCSLTLPDPT